MKKIIFIPAVFLLVFMTSCDAVFKTIHGEGPVVSQEIQLDDFHEIEISSVWEVELIPAPQPGMIIHTEENLIPMVTHRIHNGRLIISHEGSIGKSKSKVIQVFFRQLDKIVVSTNAQVFSPAIFEQNYLELEATTSGVINLKAWVNRSKIKTGTSGIVNIEGICKDLKADATTSSQINAAELKTEKANLTAATSANISVYVSEKLIGRTKTKGKINYFGNPREIDLQDDGDGKSRSNDRIRSKNEKTDTRSDIQSQDKTSPVRSNR